MRIAIASGKGGTGKTTVATNLAFVLGEAGERVAYLDCDVEEPNGHLFLRPEITASHKVNLPVPRVDEGRCTFCRECSKACRRSAILVLPKKVLTFEKLCNGCGGCVLACPEQAIGESERAIGVVEEGLSGGIFFAQGRLDIGEAISPPVIRAVKKCAPAEGTVILDSPPGTSCPVIETVKDTDVVLLVTEPTPFGLNDLKLAVGMVRALGIPLAVAVNRVGAGDREVFDYCRKESIPVLLEIADDRRIAEGYSRGRLALEALPELKPHFLGLADGLRELGRGPRPARIEPEPIRPDLAPAEFPSARVPPGQGSNVVELVVISGKGGTGKTSVAAAFFSLAEGAVVADCDVDAADLHLVLGPEVKTRWAFSGGAVGVIDPGICDGCGICAEKCRFGAIVAASGKYLVESVACEGCGVCADACPMGAASMAASTNGEWFVSETRFGPMVHARLGIAEENSGKLVSLVRREARAVATGQGKKLLISDGSPGIGCPVIASITGAQAVLVVSEPTLSGMHDLKRVAELTRHFGVRAAVCVNKFDINPEIAGRLEEEARQMGLAVLGRIRYDPSVTRAQVQKKTVTELADCPAAQDLKLLWGRVGELLSERNPA